MSRVPVRDLAKFGVVQDADETLIPPNAWTRANNVRFRDGKIISSPGHIQAYEPPAVPPYWLMQTFSPVKDIAWIYAGLTKVYTYLGGLHTDISRTTGGAYTTTMNDLWNGGVLAGIPVINNGQDVPQYWANVAAATKLANLTNWPPTWRASVVRPFRNFLIAMNILEGPLRYIHRVRWSSPAQPGGIPPSWDDTDPTQDAGIIELTDTESGAVIDGLSLGDLFMVYKERSIWSMQFVGGQYKFNVKRVIDQGGALAQNCIASFGDPAKHCVFSGVDIYQHDGQTPVSMVSKQLRRWIMANIDTTNYRRAFVVSYADQNEIWVCFPTGGSAWANVAIIINILDGSVFTRDLTNASYIASGVALNDSADTWDVDTLAWNADGVSWDATLSQVFTRQLLQADPILSHIYIMDQTNAFNSVPFNCLLERTGLSLAGTSNTGDPISDPDIRKLVKGMWVQARSGPISVTIGRVREHDGPITWGTPQVFQPGANAYVGFLDDTPPLDARTFGVRFQWQSNLPGLLDSYDLDIEALGEY